MDSKPSFCPATNMGRLQTPRTSNEGPEAPATFTLLGIGIEGGLSLFGIL